MSTRDSQVVSVTTVSTAPRDFFAYVVNGDKEKVLDAIKLDEDLVRLNSPLLATPGTHPTHLLLQLI
jgi:hypothetical protein